MFYPDNFLYFITLVIIGTVAGTHLWFSYARNRLLILNIFMFVLCVTRACTEYYLPQVDSFETATQIAVFHSLVTALITQLFHYCIWLYIRPFKGSKYEKVINQIYVLFFIIISYFLRAILLFNRKIYFFHEEQIEGYWKFSVHTTYTFTPIFLGYNYVGFIIMITIFLFSIIRDKTHRLQKSFLLGSFVVLPFIYYQYIVVSGEINIPNSAGIFLLHSLIVSWFVSGYRLFKDGFAEAQKDLLNSISDLAISTDLNTIITGANDKTKALFPIHPQPFSSLLASFSTFTVGEIDTILKPLINQQTINEEISLQFDHQVEKIFSIKVAPLKINGGIQAYTFLLTDLTDIKQKERQLNELNHTKDRLFVIIGHDLRKPALAFRGIAQKVNYLIQQKDFKTLNKFGEHLDKAAFALNSLLDNLLNWALKQQDVLPYDPQPFDVEEASEEIYELFRPIAADKNIALQFDIPADTRVFTDINAFSTIIRNLLDNAIKYSPSNGLVQFKVRQEADKVKLNVIDHGVGITKASIPQLFDFRRNKSTRGTAGEKGSGLGLTLVRDLVKLNKGSIQVWSEVSKGTTFEILLPRA